MQSPWQSLKPLYVLPEDFAAIVHHRNYSNLRLDALPGQFIGGLDKAEVVFLLLNPGFDQRDVDVDIKLPGFLEANFYNHTNPYASPFYYFNKAFKTTAGYEWWNRILGSLLRSGLTKGELYERIMVVEYFPYHSKSYKDLPILPSQQHAFDLVDEAIKRDKTIVIMRSKDLWYKAVPALEGYTNKIIIKNPRAPYVSPKNLGEENYKALVLKLMTPRRYPVQHPNFKLEPLQETETIPVHWEFSQDDYDKMVKGGRSNWYVYLRDDVVHICHVLGKEFYRFTLSKTDTRTYVTNGLEILAEDGEFEAILKSKGVTDKEIEQRRVKSRDDAIEETTGFLEVYFGIHVGANLTKTEIE